MMVTSIRWWPDKKRRETLRMRLGETVKKKKRREGCPYKRREREKLNKKL